MNRYRVRDKKNIWDSVPVDEVSTIAIMLEDQNVEEGEVLVEEAEEKVLLRKGMRIITITLPMS